MPSEAALAQLLDVARDLTRNAKRRLAGNSASPEAHRRWRTLRAHCTLGIEGEQIQVVDIERALQQEFSKDVDLARKQRLALAHIRAEAHCEDSLDRRLTEDRETTMPWLYSTEALTWLHRELFRDLPVDDLRLADGSLVEPGELRHRDVAVGQHVAPSWESLPRFLDRWHQVYAGVRPGEASVIALAAAHHRLVWIHPFVDGNGRVARLHTHLVLRVLGLTDGRWSPVPGIARTAADYKALLQAADEPRRGDLDGRGNLTQAGLVAWIAYMLEVCVGELACLAKRSVIPVELEDVDLWLSGTQDEAKQLLRVAPVEVFDAGPVAAGRL